MDPQEPLRLSFDRFELDEANAVLSRAGEPVAIPPKAFDVLCALLRKPGMLVTKDQLLDAVWGHRHVSESVLKTTISELRGVLQDDARSPRLVETAARRGYRFIGRTAAVVPAPAVAVPLAPAVGDCVGREAERGRLAQWWAQACTGESQLCWLAGEAGIGKTTVIDSLVASLGRDVTVARGQCVEQFGAGEPYLPVLDALAALCRKDDSVLAQLRETAPTWLLQMPWLIAGDERERLRTQLTGVTQDRMLREFAEFTGQITAHRPWLLVTEDLHWADGATLRLLDHVARRRAPARFMWLSSFRVAELVAAGHPLNGLRHEWRTRRLGHELLLEPFSEEELGMYLVRRSSAAVGDEDLVREIHRQTDGLPLFVANLVDDLLARGMPDARAVRDATVPASLAGLVEAQVARLDAGDVRLLQAASICGVQFGIALLANVLECPVDDVARACDRLAQGQHWIGPATVGSQPDGSLDAQHTFRHALYPHVIHQHLGAMERARLHRRAAQALAQRRDAGMAVSAAELAAHCEAGHDFPGALRAWVAAVEHALGRFAPFEALDLCDRATALLPRCPEGREKTECELELAHFAGAAYTQTIGVTSPQAQAAIRRAGQLSDSLPATRQRAWAMAGLCLMHSSSGNYDEATAIGLQLREIGRAEGDPRLAAVGGCGMGISLMQQGQLGRALELFEESVAATSGAAQQSMQAAIVLDPVATVRGLGASLLTQMGRTGDAMRWLDQALARTQAIGQPLSRGFSLRCAASVYVRLRDARKVGECARAMAEIVRAHSLSQGGPPSQCLLGWAEAATGNTQAGRALIAQGCKRLLESGSRMDITLMMYLAADAALHDGDATAAHEYIEQGFALADQMGERLHVPELLLARARIESGRGQIAAAHATLEQARVTARAMGAVMAEQDALAALDALQAPAPNPDRTPTVR